MTRPPSRSRTLGLIATIAVGILALTLVVMFASTLHSQVSAQRREDEQRRAENAAPAQLPGLVWSSEFDGPAGTPIDTATWTPAIGGGGWGNQELQAYTDRPENLGLDGQGDLAITAQRESSTDRQGNRSEYTSARIQSVPTAFYGRIEARIKVPSGAGLWSAFWTLGENHETAGWPASGEIDIVETMNDTARVHANVHAATFDDNDTQIGRWQQLGDIDPAQPVSGDWHVYAVEWRDGELRFFLDDQQFHTIRRDDLAAGQSWPFDQPQQLLLNLAVGGGWPGPPDASTPLPASMLVDYVRVFDESVLSW